MRSARSRDQNDLAVARQVQAEPRLGAGHEHRAALRGTDAALEIGAVPVHVGAAGPQIGELAGRPDGGGLALGTFGEDMRWIPELLLRSWLRRSG